MSSARDRIRVFFEKKVGKIVTTEQIKRVARISEFARRIRELRGDEGMEIQSLRDGKGLKPNQYKLVTLKRHPRFSHKIDKTQRSRILERNECTCRDCGLAAGDPDPLNPSRKITLHIHHIYPDGPTTNGNLKVLCHNCNEGRSNRYKPPKQNTIAVLGNISKLERKQQRIIYNILKKRFMHNK